MPSLARELMPCLALAGVLVSKAGRGEGGWGAFGGDCGCRDGTTLRASAPHFTQKGPPLRGAPHFTQKFGIVCAPWVFEVEPAPGAGYSNAVARCSSFKHTQSNKSLLLFNDHWAIARLELSAVGFDKVTAGLGGRVARFALVDHLHCCGTPGMF
jgi:hypothetical protein